MIDRVPPRRLFSRRPAFTLVELLVVIGIIALLISILLPALSRARDASKSVACLSNQRQLGTALPMFTNDHENWLPKAWFNDFPRDMGGGAGADWGYRFPKWGWEDCLITYLGEGTDIFLCPGDDTQLKRNVSDDNDPVWNNNFPGEDPTSNNYPGSYRYNISNHAWTYKAIKITQLTNSTKAILIVDAVGVLGDPNNGMNWNQVATHEWEHESNIAEENMRLVPVDRHNQVPDNRPEETKLNLTFADGHSAQFTWKETWEPMGERILGAPATGTDFPTMWRQVWDPNRFGDIAWNTSMGAAPPGSLGR